jgi:broad specificity phosphatase PhoE
MGAWTGLTGEEIEALMPAGWFEGNNDRIGPGAETVADVRQRAGAFIDQMMACHAGQRVAVVSHGGTIGAMVSMILGMPPVRRQPFGFGNTSITELTNEDGRWRLRSLNDRYHLMAMNTDSETVVE